MFTPDFSIPKLNLPDTSFNVALHFRAGDHPQYTHFLIDDVLAGKCVGYMNKFLPRSYYVTHIRFLKKLLPNHKLHICIFTDAKDPNSVLKGFQKAFDDSLIKFSLSSVPNSPQRELIEIFHMTQFDCLIRPCSAFSFLAQLIGSHKLVLHP